MIVFLIVAVSRGELKQRQGDCLLIHPPYPLPLIREGGVDIREGQSPSLNSSLSPSEGERDTG